MSKFLNDEMLDNLTVTEELMESINTFLIESRDSTNKNLNMEDEVEKKFELFLDYIIRFDNTGYRLDNFNDVIGYFRQAKSVERVIFRLFSKLNMDTNSASGDSFEVRFDAKQNSNSNMQVSSDVREIADSTFHRLTKIISKHKNYHWIIRNAWSQLFVQIIGVAVGFVLSLVAAVKFSPYLTIENPFAISFLFALLIFSNMWGFINQRILTLIDYLFPNIQFSRKGKNPLYSIAQGVAYTIVATFALYLLSLTVAWVGSILGGFILIT